MKYNSPNSVICLFDIPLTQEGYLSMRNIQLRKALGYLMNLEINGSALGGQALIDIRNHITRGVGITPTDRTIQQMFLLYPFEASVIIDNVNTEEACQTLLHMVSHFYLNSWWPSTPRENDDVDDGVTEEEWAIAIQASFTYLNRAPF